MDSGSSGVGDFVLLFDPCQVFYCPVLTSASFNAEGGGEIEYFENLVEAVMAHVAECSAAEIVPAAEYRMCVGRVERAVWDRSQPEVPVHAFGDARGVCGEIYHSLRPEGARRPVVDRVDGANCACGNPFGDLGC